MINTLTFIKIIYAANILVAGSVGLIALFSPQIASNIVFNQAFSSNNCMKIIGAFWTSIALLSILGFWFPREMIGLLLLQLSYKSLWLFFGALPSIVKRETKEIPFGMTIFFLIWVLVLSFVLFGYLSSET